MIPYVILIAAACFAVLSLYLFASGYKEELVLRKRTHTAQPEEFAPARVTVSPVQGTGRQKHHSA